ncbi:MAG: ABC transporter ATP-binding protein, partial [Anaerolineae bacterium]|nr:ABC transporter ATP-binding protein [Anaerolineae bacterium]
MHSNRVAKSEKESTDLNTLWRAYAYLRPHWLLALGGYALLFVINGLSLLSPQLIRGIVDRGIAFKDLDYLGWMVVAMIGLALLQGVLGYFQGKWIEQSSQNVAYDLRNEIYKKVSSLSFSYHDRTETGQLLARVMHDVDRLRFLNGRASMRLIEGAVMMVSTVIIVMLMNPRLALLSLLSMPILTLQAYYYSKRMRPMWRSLRDKISQMTSWVEQNLRGARIVKGFAQESAEIRRFSEQNDDWLQVARDSARVRAINDPLVVLITNISTIFIIWYGGRLVAQGALTLGELVAFNAYMGQLAGPMRILGRMIPFLTEAAASGERIFEVLDTESEVKESPDAVDLP